MVYLFITRRLARFRAPKLPLAEAARRATGTMFAASRCPMVCEPNALIAGAWLQPDGAHDHNLLLYLHGGAYVQGSLKTYRALAARLGLACRARPLLINYPLSPLSHGAVN